MKKFQRFIILLLLFLCLLPSLPVSATEIRDLPNLPDSITNDVDESQTDQYETTSPWLDGNEDTSIYSNALDGGNGSSTQITPDTPGKVEKYISELLRNIASSLIGLLNEHLGASLDSIVYGRVGSGHPSRVNIFSFELRKGNPYGVTGAVAYSVLRSIAYIFMGLQFIYLLAKASFSGYTAKSREELKNAFYTLILNFCLLALMPFFLDIALYIRDVILYGLKEVTAQLITGGGSLNLSDAFYMVSENSGRFVDAVMYLGTVALTIYFACIYVSVAMDMLVCFVVFPITCVLGKQNKNNLEIWCMNILSDICTPVVDAVLLLVPLLTSVMLSNVIAGVQIIQLIMCMLVIPMRGQIKEKLGLGRGGERYGMLGAMTGFAVGRMLMGRIRAGVGRLKEAYGNAKRSREYGELARVDEEEEESLVSDYNSRRGYGQAATGGSTAENTSAERDDSIPSDSGSFGNPIAGSGDGDWEADSDDSLLQPAGADAMEGLPDNAVEASGDEPDSATAEIPRTREDVARDLQESIEDKEAKLADLRVEKAGYQQKEKEQRLAMMDMEGGTQSFKKAQKSAAEYALKASETEKRIQKAGKELSQLRGQAGALSGSGRGLHTGYSGPVSDFDAKRAAILAKHANVNNFEQPEFKGVLSNARLKELYRARAIQAGVQTAAGAAGAVGGGIMLGSLGSFMPASTSLMLATGGSVVGSAAARAGAGAAMGGVRMLAKMKSPAGSGARDGVGEITVEGIPENAGNIVDETVVIPIMPQNEEAATPGIGGVHIDAETGGSPENEVRISEISVGSGIEDSPAPHSEKTARMKEIQMEAVRTLNKMVMGDRGTYNNLVIRALKDANLQVEAYLASMDEEAKIGITQEETQAYRIEMQTEKIVETLLGRMASDGKLEKGSADYKYAREYLKERVYKIVEEKNQKLL